MLRGVVVRNTERLGAKYKARVYLFAWGVHIEGNGDTEADAAYPVKRAIRGLGVRDEISFALLGCGDIASKYIIYLEGE